MTSPWFHTQGSLTRDGWDVVVDERVPGWHCTGLHVGTVSPSKTMTLPALACERLLVPLAGTFTVVHRVHETAATTRLDGRASVFDGPTDVLYVPVGAAVEISGEGRIAIASAPATETLPARRIPADEVQVELRGSGASSRQVNKLGTPEVLDAARLIVCEVITPAGNWSSYPPHRHDEQVPGEQSRLEEIYYFESAPTRGVHGDDAAAFGVFVAYGSPVDDIDINRTVRSGDVALVPFGYHGPAAAAPGYDLYYLNVMAGPDAERQWLIADDPAHAWVRDSWRDSPFDPRLPYVRRDDKEMR